MTTRKTKTPGVFLDVERRTYGYTLDLPGADGERKQIRRRGFASMKAAAEARAELARQSRTGSIVLPDRLTIAAYVNDTWLPLMERRVRPTTADTYRRLVRLHIVPALGGVQLQQLQRAAVARWVGDLQAKGLSAKSVRNIHGVLMVALDDARELGLVTTNVASKLRQLPRTTTPTPRAWTTAQTQRFLERVSADRWAPMWRVLAVTGVRRGELVGLRWEYVDLTAGTVTIARQRAIAGGVVVEGAPKTAAGNRTIAIDAATVAALRSWRAAQNAERLLMGEGWAGDDFVFAWPDGTPLWPQTVSRWFREHCDALGLPPIGVHGMRHSVGTFMIGAGENPKLVQQRLGHSKVSTTIGLYTHVMPGHDQRAADAMAAALDGP